MTLREFMREVGLPEGKGYESYAQEWMDKGMTVSDALTQHCDNCRTRSGDFE